MSLYIPPFRPQDNRGAYCVWCKGRDPYNRALRKKIFVKKFYFFDFLDILNRCDVCLVFSAVICFQSWERWDDVYKALYFPQKVAKQPPERDGLLSRGFLFLFMRYIKGNFAVVPNLHCFTWKTELLGVYVYLCKYANDEGECFPSKSKLSEDTGLSERTVQRHLQELCSIWAIQKTNKYRADGSQSSNSYEILIVSPPRDTDVSPVGVIHDSPPRDTDVSPLTIPDITIPDITIPTLLWFSAFYEEYPLKKWRWQAEKAYKTALKKETPEKILAMAEKYRDWCKAKNEKKYIKHPATWLNGECWDDELQSVDEIKKAERPRNAFVQKEDDEYALVLTDMGDGTSRFLPKNQIWLQQ